MIDMAQKDTLKFLKNYHADLDYLSSMGRESMNHVTNGTPYFENENDMHDYLNQLESNLRTLTEEETP